MVISVPLVADAGLTLMLRMISTIMLVAVTGHSRPASLASSASTLTSYMPALVGVVMPARSRMMMVISPSEASISLAASSLGRLASNLPSSSVILLPLTDTDCGFVVLAAVVDGHVSLGDAGGQPELVEIYHDLVVGTHGAQLVCRFPTMVSLVALPALSVLRRALSGGGGGSVGSGGVPGSVTVTIEAPPMDIDSSVRILWNCLTITAKTSVRPLAVGRAPSQYR